MKTKSKALLLVLCAVLLVVSSVFGTMAYLTDTGKVTNTFAVGQVHITLNEAKVNEYGQMVDTEGKAFTEGATLADRVIANDYKLIPGHTYVKDPTVTIQGGSEPAYIRMLVTVNDLSKLTKAITKEANSTFYGTFGSNDTSVFLLQNLVNGWDNTKWVFTDYTETKNGEVTSATYEFRYNNTVGALTDSNNDGTKEDVVLDALFDSITVPTNLDNEQIANLEAAQITIEAQAIQADGFENANAAWVAFVQQYTGNLNLDSTP